MKRIERIYNYIIQKCRLLTLKDIESGRGLSAEEICKNLEMLRNNVSLELNNLFREDKIIKIKGRPVLFLDRETVEKLLKHELPSGPLELENFKQLFQTVNTEEKDKSPFDDLIGHGDSLKTQIEQAKAAVLYPPHGLNTLIVGPTGVGKTLFANMMYKYAKYIKKLDDKAPFVMFNCADYYNNPQLLISQMFGHIKGAFTGADAEKEGLVQKADGGILLLDEIHRLPPEGQEMLFYFMDNGTYNRLGETERKRKSTVLIIAATTEDPLSSLLKTFTRRIPMVITLPALEERYADGYNRLLSNKAKVMINSTYAPIVGQICMDQCMIDVTDTLYVKAGDDVLLIGETGNLKFDAENIADLLDTISYEVLCSISKRVPRIYMRDGQVVKVRNYV